ncbi:MAG: bifunctional heptose 7-phosphate kinase/heptose 1-phosphate adenyltransferase [Planctomycetes bacterium]|nr:bifunctional heptose 7-phosphate kinase/heptose 1-phosphate adenyltransferase [Planctomycetota bacterium]
MASSELTELLNSPRRPRVLVVGDVMLDRYVWGDMDRISPEAPIPVLSVAKREERLGGAGSVVAMLAALEADVVLATVTADDAEGHKVRDLLAELGAVGDCTLVADDRSTTVKERLLGRTQSRHPQQIIRVDRETTRPIGEKLAGELLRSIEGLLGEVDVVLVSDYRKGVCAGRLVVELAALGRRAGVPVVADPAADVDYGCYAGCTCITPNRAEAGSAVGQKIETPADGLEAARRLLEFDVESAVVTLDRDGIAWADRAGNCRLFPVHPRQVYDITGAGDTVLAALGFGLGAGADWPTAIELANLAGGLEVQRLGVTPLARGELLAELSGDGGATEQKVVSVERLEQQLLERRRAGQRIVMTNGCFDLLHPGHVASLRHARSQGDCLIVGLNSDRSVAALKGAGRPIIDEQGRAEILAAMELVDYVVVFDETSVAGLVERLMPDVLVKSAEYAPEEVVGHEIVRGYGGRVVLAPMQSAYGTSGLIERIRDADRGKTSND